MEKTTSQLQDNPEISSPIFNMIATAYRMVREGKEKDAKKEYPLEYHLIKKYLPSSIEELTSLLKSKLQII